MFLYLDAGSGSYLIQVIVAAFAAIVLYFNKTWFRIKYFFSKNKDKSKK